MPVNTAYNRAYLGRAVVIITLSKELRGMKRREKSNFWPVALNWGCCWHPTTEIILRTQSVGASRRSQGEKLIIFHMQMFSMQVSNVCATSGRILLLHNLETWMKLNTYTTLFYRRDFACLITYWRKGVWWRLASQFKLCLNCPRWKYLSFPPCNAISWKLWSSSASYIGFLHRNIQAIKN